MTFWITTIRRFSNVVVALTFLRLSIFILRFEFTFFSVVVFTLFSFLALFFARAFILIALIVWLIINLHYKRASRHLGNPRQSFRLLLLSARCDSIVPFKLISSDQCFLISWSSKQDTIHSVSLILQALILRIAQISSSITPRRLDKRIDQDQLDWLYQMAKRSPSSDAEDNSAEDDCKPLHKRQRMVVFEPVRLVAVSGVVNIIFPFHTLND